MRAYRTVSLIALTVCGLAALLSQLDTAKKVDAEGVTAASPAPAAVVPSASKEPRLEPQDFETRCHASGVLTCEGFDSPEGFAAAKWPASGLYPAWDGAIRGTLDTTVKASGGGSLKFTIPSYSAANSAGYWMQAMGKSFGEGGTFYVQFRQRFSPEMLSNSWGVDTYWKQAIFHNLPQTCADVALATINHHRDGYPVMYSQCGSDDFFVALPDGDFLVEQGDYNCHYHNVNSKSCFMYPADTWITFYYKVSIGHWGRPDSTIQAWVSLPGQPYKQWIDIRNHKLLNASPGSDYDTVTLLAYMTAKDPTKYGGPTAYTWYDELIVSTQPVAPPK